MASPAERIYEAAASTLSAQEERAARITASVAPVSSAAAAATLLVKPAIVKLGHAGVWQITGLVLGGLGALAVLFGALAVLVGVQLQGVDPTKLQEAAAADPSVLTEGDRFHLEAALTLGTAKKANDEALRWLGRLFVTMTGGLVAEIFGLALAVVVHS
jgi:hypothetical protein